MPVATLGSSYGPLAFSCSVEMSYAGLMALEDEESTTLTEIDLELIKRSASQLRACEKMCASEYVGQVSDANPPVFLPMSRRRQEDPGLGSFHGN